MKKLLNLALLLLCPIIMNAQTKEITLDELLGRLTIEMTEKQFVDEFKNELHLLDSLEKQNYIMSEDMTATFLGGVTEIKQKSVQMGGNEETIEYSVGEMWVITVDIDGFGRCAAFAQYKEGQDGYTLGIMLPKEIHTLQSTYVLKKAKNALSKYAQAEYVELLSTESMNLYTSIWEKGMITIMQAVSDSQCLTLFMFQITAEKPSEEDLKMAAEYMKNGTMPEEPNVAENESFEFPSIRKSKWGDSMLEVMKKEGVRDELTNYNMQYGNPNQYIFDDRIGGYKCTTVFVFTEDDRAYQLLYSIGDVAKESCLVMYNNLKYSLKNKYGAPTNEEVNKRYDWTKEDWREVYYGNLSYRTSWVTDDLVHIELRLNTSNNRIHCAIHYIYLPLYLMQEEKESDNF